MQKLLLLNTISVYDHSLYSFGENKKQLTAKMTYLEIVMGTNPLKLHTKPLEPCDQIFKTT